MSVGALGLLQCHRQAQPSPPGAGVWEYELTLPLPGSFRLTVESTIERAPGDRLVGGGDAAAFDEVTLVAPGRDALARREGDVWVVPECRTRCRLRYTVDVDVLAAGCRRLDCGRRVGDAVVSQASAWMLRPETPGDAEVRVRLRPGSPATDRFATGLRRAPGGGYVFHAEDLGEASYTAFGSFRRQAIDLPGGRLDLVLLGAPIAMGDAAVVAWVRGAAGCVAGLFGRFPVDATVFIVPAAVAEEVVFGRVMSLAGASVVLLFGAEARPENAPRDWVAVHELFHLACPSFVGEGHWLEEGLATYYEPILRERAGWMTEAELWGDFVCADAARPPQGGRPGEPRRARRHGLDVLGRRPLRVARRRAHPERASGQRRRRARSLDDALRAVLAREGDATHRARRRRLPAHRRRGRGRAGARRRLRPVGRARRERRPHRLWRDLGVEIAGPLRAASCCATTPPWRP